jgi:hypothetical protein
MKNRYGAKANQMIDNSLIPYVINGITHQIKASDLKLIDAILLPEPNEELETS